MLDKPLFKLCYEEYVSPKQEVCGSYTIYVKPANYNRWIELYNTFSEEWAKIAFKYCKDHYDTQILNFIKQENLPTMFQLHDQMYKVEYVFVTQSCVVGSYITGNDHYGQKGIDADKFDYIKDIIFFYNKGECVVVGNQLFMDGTLLLNVEDLKNVCKELNMEMYKLDSAPYPLLGWIKNKYPLANWYECNGNGFVIN